MTKVETEYSLWNALPPGQSLENLPSDISWLYDGPFRTYPLGTRRALVDADMKALRYDREVTKTILAHGTRIQLRTRKVEYGEYEDAS